CVDFVSEHGLTQIVREPTRHVTQSESSQYILDVGFTNYPERFDKVLVVDGFTDHKIFHFSLQTNVCAKQTEKKKVYFYQKADSISIKVALQRGLKNFEALVTASDSIDEIWENFSHQLSIIQKKFVPSKMVSSFSPPWETREIRNLKRKCRALHKHRKKSAADESNYKEVFYKLRKLKQAAENNFLLNSLDSYVKIGSRKFFQYVNQKKGNGSCIPTLKNKNDVKHVDSESKAELLNQHFSSVYIREDDVNIPVISENDDVPGQGPLFFSISDIVKIIKSVKSNKAPGPD